MSFARTQLQELFIKEARVEIPRPEEPVLDADGNPKLDENENPIMKDPGPIVFYARKMNPLQQESASRMASAAQIHMRRLMFRKDDPDYLIIDEAVNEIDDISMFVALVEISREKDKMEQELSDKEEWAKDNYYQSLIDAWPACKRDFTENAEEDRKPETNRLWGELKRFNDELEDISKKRRQNRAAEIDAKPEEEQRRLAFEILLEQQCNTEWMRVFNVWRMIYGIVDEDKNRVFETDDDVMSTPVEAQKIFRRALDELSQSITDVKS